MFSKYDLETLTVKVLNDNPDFWFSIKALANCVLDFYKENPDEFYIGHFLFVWEKLLINTNFILVKNAENSNNNQVKIKSPNNSDKIFELKDADKIGVIQYNLDKQLKHMINNKQLYCGSKLIEQFLIKHYDFDKFYRFFEIYGDCLTPIKKIIDSKNTISNNLNNESSYSKFIVPTVVVGLISYNAYQLWLKYRF